MGEGEYIPGVLIEGILSCFYDPAEKHSPITTEDTDQRGYKKDGNVLVQAISVQPNADSPTYVSYHSECHGTCPKSYGALLKSRGAPVVRLTPKRQPETKL